MAQVEKQVLLNPSAKASKSEQGGAVLLDALTFFMQNICQAVKAVDVQEFEREVKTQLDALSIVIDRYQALDDRAVLEALPMTQYAQVLTVCYENYCEFYGSSKSRSTLCPCEAPSERALPNGRYASLNLNKNRHKKSDLQVALFILGYSFFWGCTPKAF